MNFISRAMWLCTVMLLIAMALTAQPTASLRGTILDPSGAAVPQVTVTASGPNNTVKVGQTDQNGLYTIVGLVPGQYTVRVVATGFTMVEKPNVDVVAGRPSTLDFKLAVATEKQEVTVTDTQQVELDPAKNAGALVLKAEDLDMLSDDPDDLQNDLLALAGPAAGPNGGQIFVDGFSSGQLPPKESIREIRINSNPFSSEYDTQGHGRIEILTKPGSDKFHGAINLTYSDSLFNARNPFDTTGKPFSDTKNLQSNVSGPISKKASFFMEFSRRQQREAALINAQELAPGCSSVPFTIPATPCGTVSNAFGLVAPNTFTNISPRIDYQLTTNITLQMRYSFRQSEAFNNGVGGFNLADSANTNKGHNHTAQITETQVVNSRTINETRFQYFKTDSNSVGVNPILNISVNDAFTDGSSYPLMYTKQSNYELQNYTSITHGTQFIKFGGRLRGIDDNNYSTNNFPGQFTFNSLSAYAIMQQGIAQGIPLSQIIANGGGPSQYTVASGVPLIGVGQVDAGLFFQDDWRVKPNITLSMGMRYEIQNNTSDKGDWAPRIGLAWGIGPSQGRLRTPKTVFRAGAGYFYDRFAISNVLNSERFNGVNDLTYTVTNPAFYPAAGVAIPATSQLPLLASATYHIDGDLKSPRILQTAIGLDRQLPKNVTVSFNYLTTRGLNQLRTYDINTPLPGTYAGPGTGVYPLGAAAGIYDLYSTSGNYKQSQLMFNTNARISSRITLFGWYVYGHADTDINGQPSNPYNFHQDWGRASYDARNRVMLSGSIVAPFGLRFSPNMTYNSSLPFNITQGVDQFGDTQYNSRPAFEPAGFTGPACTTQLTLSLTPCSVSTKIGNFVVNPTPGMKLVPVNYGTGFGQFNFNLRISRSWGWGERATAPGGGRQRGGGGGFAGGGGGPHGGGGAPHGPGGPMGGMMGGGDTAGKKYTLTAGVFFHNMFNNVNPGSIEGDVLSSRFSTPLALAGGGFGGGGGFAGGSQAFNRRIDFSLRFAF